jgi:hypothetical protein
MEKNDVVRIARVQCADDVCTNRTTDVCTNRTNETWSFTVRFGMTLEHIGVVSVRVYDKEFRLIGKGEGFTRSNKRVRQVAFQVKTFDEWIDSLHYVVVYNNDNLYRMARLESVPQGDVPTTYVLEDLDRTSFEYHYTKWMCSYAFEGIEICHLKLWERRILMNLLLHYSDVERKWMKRYNHKPHYVVSGSSDETLWLMDSFAWFLKEMHVHGTKHGTLFVSVQELMQEVTNKINPYEQVLDKFMVVIDMEADEQFICANAIHWQLFTGSVLLNYRLHKDTAFVLRGTPECLLAWRDKTPHMLWWGEFQYMFDPTVCED